METVFIKQIKIQRVAGNQRTAKRLRRREQLRFGLISKSGLLVSKSPCGRQRREPGQLGIGCRYLGWGWAGHHVVVELALRRTECHHPGKLSRIHIEKRRGRIIEEHAVRFPKVQAVVKRVAGIQGIGKFPVGRHALIGQRVLAPATVERAAEHPEAEVMFDGRRKLLGTDQAARRVPTHGIRQIRPRIELPSLRSIKSLKRLFLDDHQHLRSLQEHYCSGIGNGCARRTKTSGRDRSGSKRGERSARIHSHARQIRSHHLHSGYRSRIQGEVHHVLSRRSRGHIANKFDRSMRRHSERQAESKTEREALQRSRVALKSFDHEATGFCASTTSHGLSGEFRNTALPVARPARKTNCGNAPATRPFSECLLRINPQY